MGAEQWGQGQTNLFPPSPPVDVPELCAAECECGHSFFPADPSGPIVLSSSTQEVPCIMYHHPVLFWSREAKNRETQSFPGSCNQSHFCLRFLWKNTVWSWPYRITMRKTWNIYHCHFQYSLCCFRVKFRLAYGKEDPKKVERASAVFHFFDYLHLDG